MLNLSAFDGRPDCPIRAWTGADLRNADLVADAIARTTALPKQPKAAAAASAARTWRDTFAAKLHELQERQQQ